MRRVAAFGLLLVASCGHAPQTPVADAALERRLLEIAREYPEYGTVDLKFSWVQTLCRLPPVYARYSESRDVSTHGNKLYLLYAKDWKAYVPGIAEAQPVGQVIVKEAWEPREVKEEHNRGFFGENEMAVEAAKRDGKFYAPGAKHGLFIMLKDERGWSFGTVTPDGARVLQSGQVQSCAGCHRDARPDSVFGLPGRPADKGPWDR